MQPGHSQNSPRGLFIKQNIGIAEEGGLFLEDYSQRTAALTASATGVQFAGGIKLSGTSKAMIAGAGPGLTLSGSSIVFTAPGGDLPGNVDRGGAITIMSNSTGVALCLNTTGTTWRYIEVTSRQRTAGHG